jgi:DNA-binding IclR family transcriptional regulator
VDGLQTLDRALSILDLFRPEQEEWSAAEVAKELQLPLGTVSRFMRGLGAHGFLMRSGRRYRLGFAAIELGQRALGSLQLRDRLRPVTVRLAREAGETCVLISPADISGQVRVLDEAESAGAGFRIAVTLGHLLPLDEGVSKALLAHMTAEVREQVLGADQDENLEAELEEIRHQGWSMTYGEMEEGTWGISAPLLTPAGEPLAAIALVAPTARYSKVNEARMISLLLAAVRESEQLIGLR